MTALDDALARLAFARASQDEERISAASAEVYGIVEKIDQHPDCHYHGYGICQMRGPTP